MVTELCLFFVISACENKTNLNTRIVSTPEELAEAIKNAEAGDNIVLANGVWKDVQIRFVGYGTEKQPITLKAETAGNVIIGGKSDLKLGGENLQVSSLYFTNGSSPSESVIEFAINQDTGANHSRISNCTILDYNKPQRDQTDLWVLLKGRHNEIGQC